MLGENPIKNVQIVAEDRFKALLTDTKKNTGHGGTFL